MVFFCLGLTYFTSIRPLRVHSCHCKWEYLLFFEAEYLFSCVSVCVVVYQCVCVYTHAQLLQLCLTLCDPIDCSLPGSSVHGDSTGKNTRVGCHFLFQGRRNSGLISPALTGGFFTISTTWEAYKYISLCVCVYVCI